MVKLFSCHLQNEMYFLVAEQLYKRPRVSVSVCVCVSQIFSMIALVEALFFGSGSCVPLSQDVLTSNGGAWLSNATLRFLGSVLPPYVASFVCPSVTDRKLLVWYSSALSAISSRTKIRHYHQQCSSLAEQCHTQIFWLG